MENHAEFAIEIGGKTILFEAGHVAGQANGAVMASMGGTVVLSSACASPEPKQNAAFFPLTVDYRERTYATGRIPGGFFRREGRPKDSEIIASRLTDRTMRPLFPDGFYHEVTIQTLVLSADAENDADILALLAASAALTISDIPFNGPAAGIRVCRVGGEFVLNPTFSEIKTSDLDMVISATKEAFVMVEGAAKIVPEEAVLEAMRLAKGPLERLCELQEEMRKKLGKAKFAFKAFTWNPELEKTVKEETTGKIAAMLGSFPPKAQREKEIRGWMNELKERLKDRFADDIGQLPGIIEEIFYAEARAMLAKDAVRLDGRRPDEIRPITCKTAVLPRTHGSAMFQRGQTQALVSITLGTPKDMQTMEELEGDYKERFLFHYNFPAFSTGETKPDRGPGRREVGHGTLARRSLAALLPKEEDFPYTIRVVSDILASNGSTSMASVCGGSLALFDAGVPLEDHVAGIAMGLVIEGGKRIVLTDIMGAEDHFGDMDFKMAGTRSGVTGFQMDVKIPGVTLEILSGAVEQAKLARLAILDKMLQSLAHPRTSLSIYAPKMTIVTIGIDKIGTIIGPGGKNIRRLSETYNVEIEVEDDGRVFIHAQDWEAVEKARREVEAMTTEPEVGKIYKGRVVSLMDFGAFVEILPGRDGLLHVSQIDQKPVSHPGEIFKEGDEVEVKILDIDVSGKIRLSRKAVLWPGTEHESAPPHRPAFDRRPPRRDDSRPGRGNFRRGGDAGGRRPETRRGFGLHPPRRI